MQNCVCIPFVRWTNGTPDGTQMNLLKLAQWRYGSMFLFYLLFIKFFRKDQHKIFRFAKNAHVRQRTNLTICLLFWLRLLGFAPADRGF